jgi:hypothetical protein
MDNYYAFKNKSFSTLADMFYDEMFTDVTIVCDDNVEYQAHKAVLSSASVFFKQLLDNTKNKNTILYLKGTSGDIFKHIKTFIYLGSVNIPQQNVEYFFIVGADLQINGLKSTNVEFEVKEESEKTISKADDVVNGLVMKNVESFTVEENDQLYADQFYAEENEITKESLFAATNLDVIEAEEVNALSVETANIDELVVNNKKTTKKKRYVYPHKKIKCDSCDYMAAHSGNLKVHTMSRHEGKQFQCDQCTMSFKNLATVRDHVKRKHENLNFPCNHCEFKSSSMHHLKVHTRWKHEGIMFQCDECGYKVGTKDGLVEHKNFRHKEKTFKCFDGCHFIGSTPASLWQHQKSKFHK